MMTNKELDLAIWEIIKHEEANQCSVFDDGDIYLDVNITPTEIVAIAELLKKEGRV